jgi:hypothetical protein
VSSSAATFVKPSDVTLEPVCWVYWSVVVTHTIFWEGGCRFAGRAIQVTEWDAWMMRRTWSELRSRWE